MLIQTSELTCLWLAMGSSSWWFLVSSLHSMCTCVERRTRSKPAAEWFCHSVKPWRITLMWASGNTRTWVEICPVLSSGWSAAFIEDVMFYSRQLSYTCECVVRVTSLISCIVKLQSKSTHMNNIKSFLWIVTSNSEVKSIFNLPNTDSKLKLLSIHMASEKIELHLFYLLTVLPTEPLFQVLFRCRSFKPFHMDRS